MTKVADAIYWRTELRDELHRLAGSMYDIMPDAAGLISEGVYALGIAQNKIAELQQKIEDADDL